MESILGRIIGSFGQQITTLFFKALNFEGSPLLIKRRVIAGIPCL